MLRRICVLTVAVGLMLVPGADASLRSQYLELHKKSTATFGRDLVGRNIVADGMPARRTLRQFRGGHDVRLDSRPATRREIVRSVRTMRRWLAPPPPAPRPSAISQQQSQDTSPVQTAATPAPSGGGGGCSGMDAESGSDGYNAVGGGGKYLGCYQIDVGHYNGGSCSGLGTDPAGQDACAQIICRTEGAGAWTNPQGQNPCGRP